METLPNSDPIERGATDGQVVAHPSSAGLEKLGRSVDGVWRGLPGNEPAWGRLRLCCSSLAWRSRPSSLQAGS
jgi:hypothetical protein